MDETESHPRRERTAVLSRRRLLALSGTSVVGSLAGCGGSDAPDGEGTDTTSEPAPTATSTTPTDTDTTERSTGTPTTEAAPSLSSYLARSPSSEFAPADGFADPSWVDEEDLEVLTVTNLQNSGEGSLRWAIEQEGPRLIVFEVGGTIDLQEDDLGITNGRCWVAGHTAPSPGITLTRATFGIDADDCVVQHVRSRVGDAGHDEGWAPDAVSVAEEVHNNVIDHCTATWSVDEALTVEAESETTTVTNCTVAEPLNDSAHPKGPHGYGSLIADGATEVTYAGNVLAQSTARNPRLKRRSTSVVVNNVMYHFERGTNIDASAVSAVVGNAYLRANEGEPNISGGRTYVADNYTDTDTPMKEGANMGSALLWPAAIEAMTGEETIDHNLQAVGARPADRDRHDERVLRQVRERSGGYIDSQEEVGGYPDHGPTTRELDVPEQGAGLGEWLYKHRRAVELPDADPP